MKRFVIGMVLALAFVAPSPAQQYATGRKTPTPAQFQALQAHALTATPEFPDAKEASYDSRTLGLIGPVKNQGRCGSCWDFSGTFVCEVAYVKAGMAKADDFALSEQYTLDCYRNGGCNGDDNSSVLKHARGIGLPLTKDYGPYQGGEGRCKYQDSMTRYKIDQWALADGQAGYESVGNTQKIKNAIKACGGVGVAIAADDRFMNVRPGQVFRGNSRDINHEVGFVGWQPDPQKPGRTVWIVRNSWGKGWCDGGYCLIEEGANMVGTQPVYALVKNPNPPPPPPVPPAPEPVVGSNALAVGLAVAVVVSVVLLMVVVVLIRRSANQD